MLPSESPKLSHAVNTRAPKKHKTRHRAYKHLHETTTGSHSVIMSLFQKLKGGRKIPAEGHGSIPEGAAAELEAAKPQTEKADSKVGLFSFQEIMISSHIECHSRSGSRSLALTLIFQFSVPKKSFCLHAHYIHVLTNLIREYC